MNAEQAREIIQFQDSGKGNLGSFPLACEAKGYLAGYADGQAACGALVKALERLRECFEFMAVETDPEILAENLDPMTIEQLHKHFEEELDYIEEVLSALSDKTEEEEKQ